MLTYRLGKKAGIVTGTGAKSAVRDDVVPIDQIFGVRYGPFGTLTMRSLWLR